MSAAGAVQDAAGDFPSALAYCERVLNLFPEDAYILCCAGSCHNHLQHYDEAVKFYDRALQASPSYGDAPRQGCGWVISLMPYAQMKKR